MDRDSIDHKPASLKNKKKKKLSTKKIYTRAQTYCQDVEKNICSEIKIFPGKYERIGPHHLYIV